MVDVDLEKFAQAIQETYPGYTPRFAQGYAKLWAQQIHPLLQPALQSWIDGKPWKDVEYQPEGHKCYSVRSIMALRGSEDCLQAMLLLSDYIADPRRGEARILMPRRDGR